MMHVIGMSIVVLAISELVSTQVAGGTILALYHQLDQLGSIQRLAYTLAADEFHSNSSKIIYYQCQNGLSDSELLRSLVANNTINITERVVLLGTCSQGVSQSWFPQVICDKFQQTSARNVVNLKSSAVSVYPAFRALIHVLNINTVSMIYRNNKEVRDLNGMLISDGLSVMLTNSSLYLTLSQVVIAFDADACLVSDKHLTFLLSVDNSTQSLCHESNANLFIINWEINNRTVQILKMIKASMSTHEGMSLDTGSVNDLPCAYSSMEIALSSLAKSSTGEELIDELRIAQQNNLLLDTGDIITIRRNDALRSIVGRWNTKMGLNLTGSIEPMDYERLSIDDYNSQLTALGIISAFAVIGMVYSAALIAFNCSKSKDRIIKLTSPNMNIMVCIGCLLALLSLPLLGTEQPILSDLQLLSTLQQAGVFTLSVGITIIYSSVLVKTWRVHRIFKKMHLSSKGTKDEHLILMITALTMIDVAINVTWAKADKIQCVQYLPHTPTQSTELVCSSKYQQVWSCLLTIYKLIITFVTLFYAWHVRHVKLPSLQDSQLILTNSLINIVVLLTSLPTLSSSETINTTRYSTTGLSALAMVYSTLSLLLAPKILLVRNNDGSKSNSAVKFLFGESLKKRKDNDEPPTGCWAGLKSCNSQSGSSIGDSILYQEIDTLKQLVKEKDETIRELTDRLFFGADKFKAYVKEKTASYRRSCSSPAVSTITEQESQLPYRMRTRPSRYNQKVQCSPVSSIDSGNIDDTYSARSQSKTQPNYYSLDTTVAGKYAIQSHSLPPIKELSINDLSNHSKPTNPTSNQRYSVAERSATPTTDSAINMSHSASSSEDESYHSRHRAGSASIHDASGRVRHILYQHQDSVTSEASLSDHAPKSNINIISTLHSPSDMSAHVPNKTKNEIAPSFIGERLAAVTDRQSIAQFKATNQTAPYTLGSQQSQHPAAGSKDEVELEILFPISEC